MPIRRFGKYSFHFYLPISQKLAHFLSAQMALVSSFFQMFIVLGMYNIGFVTEIVAFIEFEKEGKTAVVRREGICLEHVANTKPTEIISRKNLAPFVQKAGTLYLTYGPLLSEMKWL